ADATAKAWIRPQVDFALYSHLTLFTSLAPFVQFDANTSNDPWWVLQGGVDADIGLDVHALWHTYTPFEKQFTVFEFDIAKACGPFLCGCPCLPPTISTTMLVDGTVLEPYESLLVGQGEAPLEWSVTTGTLPPGLTLESDGTIAGRPNTAGTF